MIHWQFELYIKYCLKCRKNTESKNPRFVKIKSGRIILSWNCEVWDSKNSWFIKEHEAKRLLSMIDKVIISNKYLLAADKFMPEIHLQ